MVIFLLFRCDVVTCCDDAAKMRNPPFLRKEGFTNKIRHAILFPMARTAYGGGPALPKGGIAAKMMTTYETLTLVLLFAMFVIALLHDKK
jgi:hypothetical protein